MEENTNSYPSNSKPERFLTTKEDRILNAGLNLTDVLNEVVNYLNNVASDFNYYDKEETDTLLEGLHTTLTDELTTVLLDYYTKEEVDDLLSNLGDSFALEITRLEGEDANLAQSITDILTLIGDLSTLDTDIYTDNSSIVNALNCIAGKLKVEQQNISDLQDGLDALELLITANTTLVNDLDSRLTAGLVTINEALATIQDINANITAKLDAQDDRIAILETSVATALDNIDALSTTVTETLEDYDERITEIVNDITELQTYIESIKPYMEFFDTFDSESLNEDQNQKYSDIIESINDLYSNYDALDLKLIDLTTLVDNHTKLLAIINNKLFSTPIDIDTFNDASIADGWFENTIKSLDLTVQDVITNFNSLEDLVTKYFAKLATIIKEDGDVVYISSDDVRVPFPSTNVDKNNSGLVDPENATTTLPQTYSNTGTLFLSDALSTTDTINVILGRNRQTVARLEEVIVLLNYTIESIPVIPDIPEDLTDELEDLRTKVLKNIDDILLVNDQLELITEIIKHINIIEIDEVEYVDGSNLIFSMSETALETFNSNWNNDKFLLSSTNYSVGTIVDILYKRINRIQALLDELSDIDAIISRVSTIELSINSLSSYITTINDAITGITYDSETLTTTILDNIKTLNIDIQGLKYKDVDINLLELYTTKLTNTVNDATIKQISSNNVSESNNDFQVFMKPRVFKTSQLGTTLLPVEPSLNISSTFDVLEDESKIFMDYTVNIVISNIEYTTSNAGSTYEFRIIGSKDFDFDLFKNKVLTNIDVSPGSVDYKGVSYTVTPSLTLSSAASTMDDELSSNLDSDNISEYSADGIYISRALGTFNTRYGNFDQVELQDSGIYSELENTFYTLRNSSVGDFTSRLNLFKSKQSNFQIDSGVFNVTFVGGDESFQTRSDIVLVYKTRVEFLKISSMTKII